MDSIFLYEHNVTVIQVHDFHGCLNSHVFFYYNAAATTQVARPVVKPDNYDLIAAQRMDPLRNPGTPHRSCIQSEWI